MSLTTPEAQADDSWEQLSPLLDETMAELRDQDRDAIVLRYFQNKSLREVGAVLGVDEYAAQKRVGRAVGKLRALFARRGVVSTAAVIAGAIATHSVQAAPAALTNSVMVVAVAKGAAAGGSTLTLIQGAMKLMAITKLKTAALVGAAIVLATGTAVVIHRTARSNRISARDDAVWKQLQRFVSEKEAQAKAAAAAEGKEMLPEYQAVFAAAEQGDWPTISNVWQNLRQRAPQFEGAGPKDNRLVGIQWQIILETIGAFEDVEGGGVKFPATVAHDVIESIPPGSIYFGGTDPGRWLVTALQKSQVNADPFFTLTQTALADKGYLEYLRSMYGGKIYTPTDADSNASFDDYLADAKRRMNEKKLKPGESVKEVDGKIQVGGQVAVSEINARLVRIIFDKNPDREVYLEESFPLEWMYPYLEPHGLVLKINRSPRSTLPEDVLQEDHDYWTKYLKPMVGDWLTYDTSLQDASAFTESVYLKHDLRGFKGDPEFVRNEWTQKWLSKLRSSIAGVYVFRLGISPSGGQVPAQYLPKSEEERQRLIKEADFALRQGLVLCPRSPEVVYRYVNFLLNQKRNADAILVAELALRFDPQNRQIQGLVRAVKQAPAAR